MKNKGMTFNNFTDSWFNGVAEWAKTHSEDKAKLLAILKLRPSRRNVESLLKAIQEINSHFIYKDTDKLNSGVVFLAVHCRRVLDLAFRKEYRYSFGEMTAAESLRTNWMKVSAASELFSMVRQALEYENEV